MDTLKEIISLSEYTPKGGDLNRLFQMVYEQNLTRKEAMLEFKELNKTENQFRVVYKGLKENLVDGVFTHSFKDYSKYNQAQFKIFKNTIAAKILTRCEKKKAATSLATETLRTAEKYGLYAEALELARELESIWASINPDFQKFKMCQNKVKHFVKLYTEEIQAQSLFSELSICHNQGEDIKHLYPKLESLKNIATTNKEYRFNLFYFSSFHLRHYMVGDGNGMIETCKDALEFFERFEIPLPYTTKWYFHIQLVPEYLAKSDFGRVGNHINESLKLPSKGSFNWHLTLLYRAMSGFYSDKPHIAYESWKLAHKTPKKFESDFINERWRIIRAYLVWYKKIGRISFPEGFRLGKFLNETEKAFQDKSGLNVSLLVIELLFYLSENHQGKFMRRSERLDAYISKWLKGKKDARSNNFLRMLRQIELGDYSRDRVESRTKRYEKEMRAISPKISLNLLESEVVPFELLWRDILKILK